jgi:plastocyanin
MGKLTAGFILLLLGAPCMAAKVQVKLTDNSAKPLENVVFQLIPSITIESAPQLDEAIMDQVNKQFLPRILVVQKNTQVRFPNSDSIKHHVYSFSPAKVFELQLYKGLNADPLLFSKTGVVELGCNVHDWMLGYIYVVDTPYFAKTDNNGTLSLTVPEGEYRFVIWNPRIQDPVESLTEQVSITTDTLIEHKLTQDLLPNTMALDTDNDEFGDYD